MPQGNKFPRFLYPTASQWEAESFWDRVVVLPFTTPLDRYRGLTSEFERDPGYVRALVENNLLWAHRFALEGLFKFFSKGHFGQMPNKVAQCLNQYKSFMSSSKEYGNNVVAYFISPECLNFFRYNRRKFQIYKNYWDWCQIRSEEPVSNDKVFFRPGSEVWNYIAFVEARSKMR